MTTTVAAETLKAGARLLLEMQAPETAQRRIAIICSQ
jgi:hypothetical protein